MTNQIRLFIDQVYIPEIMIDDLSVIEKVGSDEQDVYLEFKCHADSLTWLKENQFTLIVNQDYTNKADYFTMYKSGTLVYCDSLSSFPHSTDGNKYKLNIIETLHVQYVKKNYWIQA